MKKGVAMYSGSEDTLYSVCGIVCQNCIDDFALFTAHKKKYTLEYINGIAELATSAESMPNQDQRQSAQTILRNAVAAANDTCREGILYLMNFINTDGFAEENIEYFKKEAGSDYYAAAGDENWKATRTMNKMVLAFVKKYPKQLSEAGMPDSFSTSFAATMGAFLKAISAYYGYRLTAERLTADKLIANNKAYSAVQSILTDGKYIFRQHPAKLKEYSYSALARKVDNKTSGFHITLTNALTTKAIGNAVITFVQSDKTFTSNELGVMDIKLAAGTYTYTITTAGYQPAEGTLVVDKNVMHRLSLTLTSLALKVEQENVA